MKLSTVALGLFIGVAAVFVLIYLESILIPFIFSIIVWFLIRELKSWMVKAPIIGKLIPVWLQNVVAFTIIIGAIVLIGMLLANNVNLMIQKSPAYQQNIEVVIDQINSTYGINLLSEVEEYMQKLNVANIVTSVLNSLSSVLSNILLVILYVLFLMLEESVLPRKLKNIYTSDSRYSSARQTILEINNSLSKYISLKTLVSLITGFASYIALTAIGVDFPLFWAILIFLLNFIPTIGSLIATLFPALMALLQFAEFTPFILVIVIVGTIQVIVGNFLEPKMMGTSLNISSLVVILSLAFWGTLWGVVGMILSVPVTVMLIIAFSKFPSTRNIAILLSGTGEIK